MGTDFLRLAVDLPAVRGRFCCGKPSSCTETHELGEELAGSYRYQLHLYDWMESNDYGRSLADDRYI
jgi:hypothetical protein